MQDTVSLTAGRTRRKRLLAGLFGILAFLLLVGLCLFAYHFYMVMTDSYGTFYSATDVADLDGDGDLDVLLHNVRQESEFTAFGGATPWFNESSGEFVARGLEYSSEGGGWASAAGDVDADGDVDLVVFIGYRLRLIFNQGGVQEGRLGEFERGRTIDGPERNGQYGSIIMGDLNDDERIDGIVVGCCGRLFSLDPKDDSPNVSGAWINRLDNDGRLGQISAITALDGLAIKSAALGDLDSDGDLDLFAAVITPSEGRNRDPSDRVIINDGQGNFTDSGQRLGETDSTAVALGDVDDDGDLDALVGSEEGASVWINQGGRQGGAEGVFTISEQTIPGDQTRAIFLADLDEDGDQDVLIGEKRRATIWWNEGQGAFEREDRRFYYTKRHGLAVEDFNGDGRPDIFAASYANDYRIWFNQGDGAFRLVK